MVLNFSYVIFVISILCKRIIRTKTVD